QADAVRRRQHLAETRALLAAEGADTGAIDRLLARTEEEIDPSSRALLEEWESTVQAYQADELVVKVRDRELRTPLWRRTLSGNRIPRVALPRYADQGDLLRFLRSENLPGRFPFTAGVFPFKRDD